MSLPPPPRMMSALLLPVMLSLLDPPLSRIVSAWLHDENDQPMADNMPAPPIRSTTISLSLASPVMWTDVAMGDPSNCDPAKVAVVAVLVRKRNASVPSAIGGVPSL